MKGAACLPGVLMSVVLLFSAAGCAHTDFERGAFESLVRLQCEDIEARGTCNRSYGREYIEWRDWRRAYLEELERARTRNPGWPGGTDKASLPDL